MGKGEAVRVAIVDSASTSIQRLAIWRVGLTCCRVMMRTISPISLATVRGVLASFENWPRSQRSSAFAFSMNR